jgi:Glycosyltransferase family 87
MNGRSRDMLAYAIGLIAGGALLIASGYADRSPDIVRHNDFAGFWAAARTIVDGGSPYDAAALARTVDHYGTQHPLAMGYPGWVALALVPFALLPLEVASAIWTLATMALAIVAVGALLQKWCPALPVIHTLAGLTLVSSHPARLTVLLGQWDFLLLAAVAAAAVWLFSGRPGRAGLAATMFIAKPHLFVASAVGFAGAAIRRPGATRFFAAAIGITIAAAVVSAIALPGWWIVWAGTVPVKFLPDPPQTTTLMTLLSNIFGGNGQWVALALILVGAIIALGFPPEGDAWLAVWLTLSSVAAIYSWSYDHLLLIAPLVIATGIAGRRSPRAAIVGAVLWGLLLDVATTLLAVVAARRDQEFYSAIVPVIAFVVVVALVWPERYPMRLAFPWRIRTRSPERP